MAGEAARVRSDLGALARPRVALTDLFVGYLRVGSTAFGFAILQELRRLVRTRGWLGEPELNEGIALVQLYPGPVMVDLTAYVGYRLRGVPGALAATLGFVLPSFVLMVALSAAYFALGALPWVRPLFLGLEALVVGIVLQMTLDLGAQHVRGKPEAGIALAAFSGLLLHLSAVLIVLLALAAGALLLHPPEARADTSKPGASTGPRRLPLAELVVVLVVVASALAAFLAGGSLGALTLGFLKIGAVAFGNGMTIMPLLQAEAVDLHGWLSAREFADGIALGQITPGPFLITAAFVGYRLAGVVGAVLGTFAIFAPSFAMTLLFARLFGQVRHLAPVRGAVKGVLASFVGMLALVTLQLGQLALAGPASLILAGGAFVGARYLRWPLAALFAVGLLAWAGVLILGWA
jgi:chromate transporter